LHLKVLEKVLEHALERVVCEGRNWSLLGFIVGEADEQHGLAGDFELVLGFAFFLVVLEAFARVTFYTAILASRVLSLNVALPNEGHCMRPLGLSVK